jgi:uncharacterized protein YndB with AHSA1/START domain
MTAAGSRVQVRKQLKAAPAKVFGAFADATLVAKWLRPSPDIKLSVLDFDFRVGGSYRFAYDTPEGMRMVVGGVYRAIAPNERLAFTWLIEPPDEHAGIETFVTVSIKAVAGGSELTIQHDRFDRADAEARHEAGWGGALELLDGLLSKGDAR